MDPHPWIPGKPPHLRGAAILFLTEQKGSNEFLEIRILIQAGAPLLLPSQGDTTALLLWESPLGSLWIVG